MASLNSKGKLLGETLGPSLEVDKFNEKTIEKMRFWLSPNPKVNKDGSIMVFRKNGFQYEKHIYIKYIWLKQPNRQGQTLGMHEELATKILPMDFVGNYYQMQQS